MSQAEDEIIPPDPVLARKLSRPVVTDDKGHIVSNNETGAESNGKNGDNEKNNDDTPACIHHDPKLNISPSGAQWSTPGIPVEFTVIVTNTSSTYCDPANFDLSASAPPGWDVSLDSETLKISSDWSTDIATMVVTSPDSADHGLHDITIAARNERLSIESSTTATYAIDSGNEEFPDAPQEVSLTGTWGVEMSATDLDEAGNEAATSTDFTLQKTCMPAIPKLILSPPGSAISHAAKSMFTITLMNNDPPACADSTFDLSITYLPPGRRGNLATRQLNLSPGEAGKTSLTVSPTCAVAQGTYRPQVGVSDVFNQQHTITSATTHGHSDTQLSGTTP